MNIETLEQLLQKITHLKAIMVAVATGNGRIKEKDEEYKQLYRELSLELESLQNDGFSIKNKNSFRSLWDWYSYWSSNLDTYHTRRQYVKELYEQIVNPIESAIDKYRNNSTSEEDLTADLQRRLTDSIPELRATFKFTIDDLHPKIVQRCRLLFETGQYDDAIFNAMKTVEEEIRFRAGAEPTDLGNNLVSKTMNPQSPKLVFSSVNAEQEAVHSLYRGAIGSFKNPLSHRFLDSSDPIKTFEILSFASLLMGMLDDATFHSST